MHYVVKVMPKALRQLGAIALWWRANRPEAPELAETEILAIIASLDLHPERGIHVTVARDPRRRMLAAPRTRLLVLYRIRPRAHRVEIVEIRRP